MDIQANITRMDLLKMNIGQLFTWPTILWFGALYLFITLPLIFGENRSPHEPWIVLISGLVTSVAVFLACWVVLVASSIFIISRARGVLGRHSFRISPDAFIEETTTNTTSTLWAGVYGVKKTNAGIYVKIAPHLVHIIPKRAFVNEAEYNQFFDEIRRHRENA